MELCNETYRAMHDFYDCRGSRPTRLRLHPFTAVYVFAEVLAHHPPSDLDLLQPYGPRLFGLDVQITEDANINWCGEVS